MTAPRRQPYVDTPVLCYYAEDPLSRPGCTLTAAVRYGKIALCPSCRAMRSTIGKEQSAIALPTAPALDVLDWVRAAHQQAAAADRTLAAAVARARHRGQSWSAIGARLGVSRQAAQQRFATPPARPAEPPATRAFTSEATKTRSRAY